jgi:type IV fimbrial biogenesis protein FimT
MHHTHRHSSTRRPASVRQHIQRGFTLIELMVVMTILIVVLAAVAPSFRSFLDGQQVKSLAFDLTTDLLLARSEALKRNASVQVARTGSAWTGGWTTATVLTNTRIGTRNASADSVTVSSTAPASITFDVYGRVSSPTSDVRITLSASGASRCVELDLSGRARSTVGACS